MLSPITRSTATEEVFRVLRQAILNHELPSGERIVETEFAERLSVSRTPVREAIRMLEAEGLVERLSNGHSIVAERSLEDMIDAFHARIALETYTVRLAADMLSEEDLAQLEQHCTEYEQMSADRNSEGMWRTGNKFHQAIADLTGNQRINDYLLEIEEHTNIYRERLYHSPQYMQLNTASHRDILNALRARDGVLAQELMREHLMYALTILQTLWG